MRWIVAVWLLAACEDGPRGYCHEPAHLINSHFGPFTELPTIAAGGTSSVGLSCDTAPTPCDHICSALPFDLPYEVEVRSGPVRFTGTNMIGSPTFYAAGVGDGMLAFVDPDHDGYVYGEVAVHAVELDHLDVHRLFTSPEPDTLPSVLATEHIGPHFQIGLLSADGKALVDDSLAMELPPGAQRWSTNGIDLFGVPSGSYVLGFQAGGKTFSEPLEIVNEADTIELWEAPATIPRNPIEPGTQESVCFMAKNQGRFITGLRWQHVIDGVPADFAYTDPCVLAATDMPSGSLATFTATAGGKSLTVQIPAR